MDKITIGRNPECDLNISETFAKVSNEHADIQLANGVLTFIDHSSNGTTINGQTVHRSEKVIKQGDKIILAESYELRWNEIEKYFPSLHRATERFDGSQVDVGGRKTEMFDGSQVDTGNRATERFDGSQVGGVSDGRKTERIGSSNEGEQIRGQVNEFTQAEIEEITEKWHMDAFLSSWVWAAANHIYWPLIIILISFIPYLGQIASLFLCTYLGLNGYKLAWSKASSHNFKSFISSQNKWTGLGVVIFILCAAIQVVALYYTLNLI